MAGETEKFCPCCGKTQPCGCEVDPRTGTITDADARFSLIPVLSDEGRGPTLRPEELGIPLVREAKFDILGPDLEARDVLELEQQVENLDALIQAEKIVEADELAGECLSRVLHFPEHRSVLLRRWWILPLLLMVIVGLTLLVLVLTFMIL